jgi:hypothetical protein
MVVDLNTTNYVDLVELVVEKYDPRRNSYSHINVVQPEP